MGRPQKEGLDYFSHDVDLSKNDKIEELEILYGNDGYATYLKLLERIYGKGNALPISDAETRQILSRKCHISAEKFTEILNTAVKLGLFSPQEYINGFLISDEIKARMKPILWKRKKMKNWYKHEKITKKVVPGKNSKDVSTVNEFLTQKSAEMGSKVKYSKVKESKVKESKVKVLAGANPPAFFTLVRNFYTETFKKRYRGEEPAFDFGKDGKIVNSKKGLFKDEAEWKLLIEWYLISKKADECGYTLSICFSTHTVNNFKTIKHQIRIPDYPKIKVKCKNCENEDYEGYMKNGLCLKCAEEI